MITTPTNLDYLIPAVQMYVGDLTESTFSYNMIRTALVYGVKSLQHRWNNRYFIYTSDLRINDTTIMSPDGPITVSVLPNEYDVFRNTYEQTFNSEYPPVIDQTDETPVILAAVIILRRSVLTSSISAFGSWSTPDLSYSNIQGSKQILSLLEEDIKALNAFFGGAKLALPQKGTIPHILI